MIETTDQVTTLHAIQSLMRAVGLTVEDLTQECGQSCVLSLAEYLRTQLSSLRQRNEGTAGTYTAPLRLLAFGDHSVCGCDCAACDAPGGCPCQCGCDVGTDGSHIGLAKDRAHQRPHHHTCSGRGNACGSRWTGRGHVPLDSVTLADLEECQAWARGRAYAMWRDRDRRRVAQGRRPNGHDGRGASENFVGAVRWLYERAIADGITTRNPGARLQKPIRQERGTRALTPDAAEEVYHVATTTGQDPEADGLLVVYVAQTAARTGGILNSRYGYLDTVQSTIRIRERKNDGAEHVVPVTPNLVAALQRHALERGPRRAAPADASEEVRRAGIPDVTALSPLLYRRPIDEFDEQGYFVRRKIRPLTKKSLENVRERVKRYLPWTDDFFLRWHDFRHTTGTMIDRTAGHAVAARHLGHKRPSDTTGIYTGADLAEDAAAVAAIFGVSHPLAPKPDLLPVAAIDPGAP